MAKWAKIIGIAALAAGVATVCARFVSKHVEIEFNHGDDGDQNGCGCDCCDDITFDDDACDCDADMPTEDSCSCCEQKEPDEQEPGQNSDTQA